MGTLSQPRCNRRERNDPSRLDPFFQNLLQRLFQGCFQLRESVPKQQTQVDALGAIVELTLVNGQAGRLENGFGKPSVVEEIPQVIIHTSCEALYRNPRVRLERGS